MTKIPDDLAGRYFHFDTRRSGKLNRARRHAELTIPALLPWNGFSQHQELVVPFNTMPAEGLSALSARTVSVIWPLGGIAVYELIVDPPVDQDVAPEELERMAKELRRIERTTMNRLNSSNLRSISHQAMLHLTVVGDVLLEQLPDYNFRLYRLDQYVVRRDSAGEWQEIIIKEMVDPDLLPERFQSAPVARSDPHFGGTVWELEPMYTQYTRIKNGSGPDTFAFRREFRGNTFDRNVRFAVPPVMPLRWSALANEDYGRSLVEESFGDIRALDGLTKSLLDGAALNAEHRWVVNPTGITELQDFIDSVNGDFVPGMHDDIRPMGFQNHAQVGAALQSTQHFEQRLGRRYLMNSAVQPQGERVTAQQVTILAQELENSLGGVLSMAARDIQIPIIRNTMFKLAQEGKLPATIAALVNSPEQSLLQLDVKAGLEVLQREAEFERLSFLVQQYGQLSDEMREALDPQGLMHKYVTAMNIEPTGIVKSREQIELDRQARIQEAQAAQLQQAAVATASNAATQ